MLLVAGFFEALGLDPGDRELEIVGQRAVDQGFLQGFVTVFVLYILPDDRNGDFVSRVITAAHQIGPLAQVRLRRFDVKVPQRKAIHALLCESERHFVNRFDIFGRDHGLIFEVAEERDLALDLTR